MKKVGMGVIALFAVSAMLVACGGGGGGDNTPPSVASSNTTAPVTSSSAAAVTGEPFTFSSGVTKFGTTSPTTVTLNSASSFSVAATEGNASGNLAYGSCIFTVTASTFPAGSPLSVGSTVTVHPCSITIATAGVVAQANAAARAVSFVLEGNASVAKDLQVDITDSGVVTVKGVTVGSVALTPATGASGG